jgi:hypothetical protein
VSLIKSAAAFLVAVFVLNHEATSAIPADWPPSDPKEYTTEVNFTLAWAKRLREFKSLADLQRAAKAKGTISQRSLEGDDPYVSFHWRSQPFDGPDVGYMLATVRPDGKISASILTTDKHQVVVSNTGIFSVEDAK